MFRRLEQFQLTEVLLAPQQPGVYIIYFKDGTPFYVGRSRVSIHDRLWKHVRGKGSSKIKEALEKGTPFQFEYEEMISVEQSEAILIKELGVMAFGNLRRETDPADWT